ncbi:MAG: hypothetical protein ABUL62_02205 [Myxococcales bacterium]
MIFERTLSDWGAREDSGSELERAAVSSAARGQLGSGAGSDE